MKENRKAWSFLWKIGLAVLALGMILLPAGKPVLAEDANLTIHSRWCLYLVEKETSQIDATSDYPITYASEDESIATVDENGLVTAVSVGKTNIVISAINSSGNSHAEFYMGVAVSARMFPLENPTYSFTTTEGTTISTRPSELYQGSTILLFGSVKSADTATMITDLVDSGLAYAGNVRIIYVDLGKASRDEVAQFKAKYGCESMVFCYDTTTDNAYNAAMDYMSMIRQNTITYPGIALIELDLYSGEDVVTCVYGDGLHSAEEIYTEISSPLGPKIDAPGTPSVKNTASGVKVTWKQVEGAKGYNIYRNNKKIGTVSSGTTCTLTDKEVDSGASYSYQVSAVFGILESKLSYSASTRYLGTAKISSLTNTSSGMKVKWKAITGVSGYYVYRKTSGGSYKRVKTITGTSTLSWTDTAVKKKNGTTYYYKVVPYYKWSSGTINKGTGTGKKTVRLTGVSVSSVKNSASKKLKVKWTKNSKASGYQIRYSTSSSFSSYKTVTVSGKSKLSRTLTSLKKGKKYYVKVRVYKTVSGTKYYSAWSSKKARTVSK